MIPGGDSFNDVTQVVELACEGELDLACAFPSSLHFMKNRSPTWRNASHTAFSAYGCYECHRGNVYLDQGCGGLLGVQIMDPRMDNGVVISPPQPGVGVHFDPNQDLSYEEVMWIFDRSIAGEVREFRLQYVPRTFAQLPFIPHHIDGMACG